MNNNQINKRKVPANAVRCEIGDAPPLFSDDISVTGTRALIRSLLKLQEAERQAISRDLHDVTGQSLTVLKLVLDKAAHCTAQDLPDVITEAVALVDEAAERVRVVSRRLRPGILDLSLLGALKWQFEEYTNRTGIRVSFKQQGLENKYSEVISTAVYRIIQGALAESQHVAGIGEITVNITTRRNALFLRMVLPEQDYGLVMQGEEEMFGWLEMRERAAMCGGHLEVRPFHGKGIIITAELPRSPLLIK